MKRMRFPGGQATFLIAWCVTGLALLVGAWVLVGAERDALHGDAAAVLFAVGVGLGAVLALRARERRRH